MKNIHLIPTYATFEQSKLLKEKGFNISCKEGWYVAQLDPYKGQLFPDDTGGKHEIEKPEQWQVVEWLRVNHDIWIEVHHIKTFGVNRFHIIIWKYGEEDYHTIHCGNGVGYEVWDTPQEAYSAAFDYIFNNNLI